mmetsp:Transcript_5141/g.10880  ORF Transcript_5141/g.10880 Transcript_5141/m.10880 type:complete len:198 (-) Transcript_5141:1779-2372(-)
MARVRSFLFAVASLALVADARLAPVDDSLEEAGGRRFLDGKKGGKKDSKFCFVVPFDGVDRPLLCDFPVTFKVPCSDLGDDGEIQLEGGDVTNWSYFARSKGIIVVNMENHKTWTSPPEALAFQSTTNEAEPGLSRDRFIGAGLLRDSDETTGGLVEKGPFLVFFDGYFDATYDENAVAYFDTTVDATVMDVCAELA